jgi:hypothetical protein
MKTLTRFLRTTILGGVFFLIPIVVLTIILAKALEYANKVLRAVAIHVLAASELSPTAATAMSVVIVAFVCLLAGLIARTMPAQKLVKGLETSVLSKVPAYEYLKQEGRERPRHRDDGRAAGCFGRDGYRLADWGSDGSVQRWVCDSVFAGSAGSALRSCLLRGGRPTSVVRRQAGRRAQLLETLRAGSACALE